MVGELSARVNHELRSRLGTIESSAFLLEKLLKDAPGGRRPRTIAEFSAPAVTSWALTPPGRRPGRSFPHQDARSPGPRRRAPSQRASPRRARVRVRGGRLEPCPRRKRISGTAARATRRVTPARGRRPRRPRRPLEPRRTRRSALRGFENLSAFEIRFSMERRTSFASTERTGSTSAVSCERYALELGRSVQSRHCLAQDLGDVHGLALEHELALLEQADFEEVVDELRELPRPPSRASFTISRVSASAEPPPEGSSKLRQERTPASGFLRSWTTSEIRSSLSDWRRRTSSSCRRISSFLLASVC